MSSATRRGRPPSATLERHDPALADLLVDQSLRGISKGASTRVMWRCPDHFNDPRHVYPAAVYNRTNAKNPTGCSICAGKLVVPGINDVATTHPQVVGLFVDPEVAATRTAASNKPALFSCPDPSHEPWSAPISRITVQGSRCPDCSGRRAVKGVNDLATTHPDLAAQLADPSLATTLKAGSGHVYWRCTKDPSHENWNAAVYARTSVGTGCPRCSGRIVVPGQTDLATTHPDLAAQLLDPSLSTTISKGYDQDVEWVCTFDSSHVWSASSCNRTKGVGCRICASKQVLIGFNDIAHTQPELVERLHDPQDATIYTAGTSHRLRWRCETNPDHVWLALPSRFLSPRPPGCSDCFREGRSGPETELVGLLRALLPDEEILTSNRDLLGNRQELDIVIPSLGTAIEFNGVYWHSEAVQTSNDYHAAKSRAAQEKGLRLLHVWEDDWVDRKELVVRALAHRLGAAEHLLRALPDADPTIARRAAARTLTPIRVDGTRARAFWQVNHLQGPVGSSRYFALVDDEDEIAALLGVGATNHGSRTKAVPGVWDIQRYATRGIVAGGFTRLLAQATRALRADGELVQTWTSFSNDDVSDGGMYTAAGFVADRHQPPSYRYVGERTGWKRTHRSHFTKQRFAKDPDLVCLDGWTEHQAARANGLYRIYDAGKTRWTKNIV